MRKIAAFLISGVLIFSGVYFVYQRQYFNKLPVGNINIIDIAKDLLNKEIEEANIKGQENPSENKQEPKEDEKPKDEIPKPKAESAAKPNAPAPSPTKPKSSTQPKTASQSPQKPAAEVAGTYLDSIESEIIRIVNEERKKAGLKELAAYDGLKQAARYKAKDMYDNNYFDHIAPNGDGVREVCAKYNVKLGVGGVFIIGENLYKMQGAPKSAIKASEIVDAWMNSPGHKANILKPEYTHIGVGVYYNGNICEAVQEFMGKK